jgi:hypothetical protein
MPYAAEISRANPTCLVLLTDQSSSMTQPFGRQPEKRKCDGVADAINRLLYDLSLKCARADGIREYCHVGVFGYGKEVASALGGKLAGRNLVSIGDIANNPLRVEDRVRSEDDGTGGVLQRKVKFPVWVEPQASGKTPMAGALFLAHNVLKEFLARYPDCFPPVVINISDGKPDTDPRPETRALCSLASSDGPVLLFNVHLSEKTVDPIEFPSSEHALPDNFAKLLFRMSSTLPAPFRAAALQEGFTIADDSRGFVFNADLVAVIKFLEIGTQSANR